MIGHVAQGFEWNGAATGEGVNDQRARAGSTAERLVRRLGESPAGGKELQRGGVVPVCEVCDEVEAGVVSGAVDFDPVGAVDAAWLWHDGLTGKAQAILSQRLCSRDMSRISSATSDRSWSWLKTRAMSYSCREARRTMSNANRTSTPFSRPTRTVTSLPSGRRTDSLRYRRSLQNT